MTIPDAPVHWDVTRIALIEALAAIPIGGFLTLEARSGWADAILAQLPEPTGEAEIRAKERERCAAAIRKHAGELRQLVSGDAVTAAHLDGLVVAAAFLRDGMEGPQDWEPQP